VAIRLTLSGELRPFAEFLAGLEYGPQQLAIPFLEVSRRGAVAGAKGPRTLSATVEVGGYLVAEETKKPAEAETVEGEAETPTPTVQPDAEASPPPGEPHAEAPPPPGEPHVAEAPPAAAPPAEVPPPPPGGGG